MTKKELIELLKDIPDDMQIVLTDHPESIYDFTNISGIEKVNVCQFVDIPFPACALLRKPF